MSGPHGIPYAIIGVPFRKIVKHYPFGRVSDMEVLACGHEQLLPRLQRRLLCLKTAVP